MKALFKVCVSLSVVAAVLSATEARAQDRKASEEPATAAAPDDRDSGAIIVTAQFREERVADIPLAVTAIDAATLKARNQQSIADIGLYVPNVSIAPSSSIYGNSLTAFIRGVGQNNSSFALEPGVGVYIDDVYYGTSFGAVFDLVDLSRVEVLRGPQGTLAGKNSLGGAIKLFTAKPNDTFEGSLEFGYGSFNRQEARGSINLPLSDELFLRVSGSSRSSDGYVTRLDYGCANPGKGLDPNPLRPGSCKIGTEGGTNVKSMRAALRYAPKGSTFEFNIVGDVTADRSGAVATKLLTANNLRVRSYDAGDPAGGVTLDSRFLTPADSYTTYSTYCNGGNYDTFAGVTRQFAPSVCMEPKSTADLYGVSGTVDVDLSDDVQIKSITAYRDASGATAADLDGSPLAVVSNYLTYAHRQFTQEVRLSTQLGSLADVTLGGFYYDAKDRFKSRYQIPLAYYDFLSNDRVTNESASVFAHGEFHLTPALNVIAGLRYTADDKSYTFGRTNTDGSLPSGLAGTVNAALAGLDGVSRTFKGHRFDYRLGVNYHWSDALMTYAQISSGFKGGGINPTPFVPDQVRPFGVESVTAYEAGFKADIGDGLLSLYGAMFFNKYQDIQIRVFSCPPTTGASCSLSTNAGDANLKGFELETQLHPVDGLTVSGSVGYLDFDYTQINPTAGIALNMIAPFVSKWTASASVEYEIQLGSAGSLTPRLDWSYQSSFYNNAVNAPTNYVPGRSVVNAGLAYRTPDDVWGARLSVTNLFDKLYYYAINDDSGNGLATGVIARPREWKVSISRKF